MDKKKIFPFLLGAGVGAVVLIGLIFASKQTPAAASKTEAKPRKVSPADAAQLKEKARTFLNRKEGYNPEKKSIVTIEVSGFKTADPAADRMFFEKREMAFKRAVLNAQIALFRHIRQDIPAADLKNIPGTDARLPVSLSLIASPVIGQFESWDRESKTFQIAVAVGWSFKSAHIAHAIVTGKEFKETPAPNAATIQEWLETQDISQLTGPRQYLDKNGKRWFLGTAARAYDDEQDDRTKIKNRMMAEMSAKQMAVASVFSTLSKTDNGIVQNMSARTVRPFMCLYRATQKNTLTGQNCYVTVYAISAEDVKAAFQAEKSEK